MGNDSFALWIIIVVLLSFAVCGVIALIGFRRQRSKRSVGPRPTIGHIDSITEDDNGITVTGTLTVEGVETVKKGNFPSFAIDFNIEPEDK